MSPISRPPIFCDDCASLAMATLDDAPLCAKCLQAQLNRSDSKLLHRIEPLHFETGTTSCEIFEGESWIPEP
jgi:hypothetical protein